MPTLHVKQYQIRSLLYIQCVHTHVCIYICLSIHIYRYLSLSLHIYYIYTTLYLQILKRIDFTRR